MKSFYIIFTLALCCFVFGILSAAPLRNVPQLVIQPNGDTLRCFASGDEYHNWMHDQNNYTILQDPITGYYVYAILQNGELLPSRYIPGKIDPAQVGLTKGVNISVARMQEKRRAFLSMAPIVVNAPQTGTINNLIVFIRFSDESEFTDLISTYDNLFNASSVNSMYQYYKEVSYNALSINSTFYPVPPGAIVVSYQDTNPRGYYQPYNAVTNPIGYQGGDYGTERTDREHILLRDATNAISSQVPAGLNIDSDNDGKVDNVCFIVWGSPTGWASLLWPHCWDLYSQNAYINGKQVYGYNFQLQTYLQSSGVGVLCHEMFHSLGSPDLYHYSYDGLYPVYQWDVMEWNLNPPQHMGAYMKFRYGNWISSIPEITTPGTYTLEPLTHPTNNCYKIASPNSSTEYFVVEYRKKEGTFESSLPGEGLLVYRINPLYNGNADGPPDEVYIYRPYGTTTSNGWPFDAAYNTQTGRTAINDDTNPSSFLTSGAPGGLNISGVSSIGSTISFSLNVTYPPFPFTEVFAGSLTGVHISSVAWGDFDNDGDLDILLNGLGESGPILKLYQNTGSGFTEAASFPGVRSGSIEWGDYDNNGYLDILLTGHDGTSAVSKIYQNFEGDFTEVFAGSLTGVWGGSAAWGDYDNDGDLDILLTGLPSLYSTINKVSKIYQNTGTGFTEVFAGSLTGVYYSSVAWGDYDNDGDLDILLTGDIGAGPMHIPVSKIYQNTGTGFTEVYAGSLTGVYESSAAWGDYDNDGDLDILLAGGIGGDRVSKIYQNTGDGFTEVFAGSLIGVRVGSAAWGDYDNDGDLDILLTGESASLETSKIYQNTGTGFTEVLAEEGLTEVYYSSAAWGDYDDDGDLDILLTGWTPDGLVSKIYQNEGSVFNTVPAAPTGLNASVLGNTVTLSWDKATDAQTPQNGLTYNLRIGTSSNGLNNLSPMANVSTGCRRVVRIGNANQVTSYPVEDLSAGTYYWSVQAIDNAFAGSNFAGENTFTILEQTQVALSAGWNLVSVPREQLDYNAPVVFPGMNGDMLEYVQGTGYVPAPILELGIGYWINYQNPTSISISGPAPGSIMIEVKAGWNLIGSRNTPVDLSSLVLSGDATILGDVVYAYVSGSGYTPITVINPGQGVWIYVTADCTITIP